MKCIPHSFVESISSFLEALFPFHVLAGEVGFTTCSFPFGSRFFSTSLCGEANPGKVFLKFDVKKCFFKCWRFLVRWKHMDIKRIGWHWRCFFLQLITIFGVANSFMGLHPLVPYSCILLYVQKERAHVEKWIKHKQGFLQSVVACEVYSFHRRECFKTINQVWEVRRLPVSPFGVK